MPDQEGTTENWRNIFRQFFILSITIISPWLLSACTTSRQHLERLIADTPLVRGELQANGFRLMTLSKADVIPHAKQVNIYIEGDGRPWIAGGSVVADDPTPRRPLALSWLTEDSPGALYLGRPCYFVGSDAPPCHSGLWTDGRYSEQVVATMAAGLAKWQSAHPDIQRLTLIGYSGGGALALLLAERMRAVHRVIAIAAPLDHQRWTRGHGFSPLFNSLNVADIRSWRNDVQRVLVYGEEDRNVTYREFKDVLPPNAKLIVIPGMPHEQCCGKRGWGDFLASLPGAEEL
ncbi:MAG: alpha/beta hydrolase [Proteobacteria bacterium]|nr:alpha/beta hydrolase [Pseudomonadota bacterium]